MDNLTHTQKLDYVLSIFKENEFQNQSFELIRDALENKNILIGSPDVKRIVNKLQKDGYIESPMPDFYTITFDGFVFIEYGGYNAIILKGQNELRALENAKAREIVVDNAMIANTDLLNKLTRGLLIATVFLALFALATLLIPYLFCQKKC